MMEMQKQAFMAARQFRTCPLPEYIPGIKKDMQYGEKTAAHRRICPICSLQKEAEDWNRLFPLLRQKVQRLSVKGEKGQSQKTAAGDLRHIRAEYGKWQGDYYYSPPLLLVLEVFSDKLRVAQTYHDPALAAPGDLILEKGQSGLPSLFIETWNTFHISPSCLGPCRGNISPELMEIILRCVPRQNQGNPDTEPLTPKTGHLSPFPLPRPFTGEEDLRYYFREMEKDVAGVFSSLCLEKNAFLFSSVEKACQFLQQMKPGIYWKNPLENMEQVLACACFSPEDYALSAQEDERPWAFVNLVEMRAGKVESFRPLHADILMQEYIRPDFCISGQILGIPPNLTRTRLLSFLSRGENILVPEFADWKEEEGRFYLRFRTVREDGDRLSLALIGEKNAS
jgi:hypothetical protein